MNTVERLEANEKTMKIPQSASVILPYEHDREFYIDPIGDAGNKWSYRIIKRMMDIVGSICALCVFAIPMLIIALVITTVLFEDLWSLP